jgi:hypothetical protein
MKIKTLLSAALLTISLACSALAQDVSPVMTLQPGNIEIGTFFDGTTITASGEIPENSEAVLRFIGSSCDLPMKERGKVFGIMWMNLDSLIFRGVPNVCIVDSANNLESEKGNPDHENQTDSLRLSAIEKQARIEPEGTEHRGAFEEFLKLKKDEGLYRELSGNVIYGPASGGRKSFRAEIPVPARLSPGPYRVELAALANGKIISRTAQPVMVNLTGFPGLLSKLAFGHAALYGILSTLIAIFAGLGIGLVFQSKGAH